MLKNMNKNVFKGAKPGDKFLTKNGLIGIYLNWLPSTYRAFDVDGWNHQLYIIDSCPNNIKLFNDNGTCDFPNRDCDIVSAYYGCNESNLNVSDFTSFIYGIDKMRMPSFDAMNRVAASMSTASDVVSEKSLIAGKSLILAACQLNSDVGCIEFLNKCSIVYPKNIKTIKEITYINHLGEDCGSLNTNHMICYISDMIVEKYQLSIDTIMFRSSNYWCVTENSINYMKKIIEGSINS